MSAHNCTMECRHGYELDQPDPNARARHALDIEQSHPPRRACREGCECCDVDTLYLGEVFRDAEKAVASMPPVLREGALNPTDEQLVEELAEAIHDPSAPTGLRRALRAFLERARQS